MKWVLTILSALHRAWFYVMIGVATIVLFPFLFIFTIKERYYSKFYGVARIWGAIIIYGMGFIPEIKKLEELPKGKSYVFVANHSSMTDIMMMYCALKNPFVYIGKKELAKIPLFGFFYSRSSILVDRESMRSRNTVFKEAQRRLKQGDSICLFPEGGVPEDPTILLDTFKNGPFRMAIAHQIPIVPLIFYDNKAHFPYRMRYGRTQPGILRAKVLSPIPTEGMDYRKDKTELRDKVRKIMKKELENPEF